MISLSQMLQYGSVISLYKVCDRRFKEKVKQEKKNICIKMTGIQFEKKYVYNIS